VQSSSQTVATNIPTPNYFTGWMPLLSPNQQCPSTEGRKYYIPAHPKLTCGSSVLVLITGYLEEGCQAFCQPSDARTPSNSARKLTNYTLYQASNAHSKTLSQTINLVHWLIGFQQLITCTVSVSGLAMKRLACCRPNGPTVVEALL